jgi:hemolysin activation/secretion protein
VKPVKKYNNHSSSSSAPLRRKSWLPLSLLPLALALPALAQQTPAPGDVLREANRPPVQPPKADPKLPQAQLLRPAMQAPSNFKVNVNGFRITGATVFNENDLQLLVVERLGQGNGFSDLQAAADIISNHYRSNGYLVARAYLPQQEVASGIVEIQVVEGRVGAATAKVGGTARTKPEVVQAYLDANVQSGDVVQEKALERAALLVNDLPAMSASATLQAGAAPGTTDVIVEATEGKLFSGSVDIDNFGNRFTGITRLGVQVNLNSPLGFGDALQLRIMGSERDLAFARLGYTVPVGGSGLRLGASYSATEFEICCQQNFNPTGDGSVASLTAFYPIVRSRSTNWYLSANYDAKSSTNTPIPGADRVRKNEGLTIGTSFDLRDDFLGGGITSGSLSLGGGKLRIRDAQDAAADAAGPKAAGDFSKLGLQIARNQRLGGAFSGYLGLSGQYASKNLDSSEKFGIGGAQGVRAYPTGEGTGDQGWLAQLEVRADLPEALGLQWQTYVFYDHGQVQSSKNAFVPNPLVPNSYELKGAGIGFNVAKAGLIQVRAQWAHKVGSNPARNPNTGADSDGKKEKSRVWVQAVGQF